MGADDIAETAVVEVRADLDLPGETARQTKTFAVWLVCLVMAIAMSSIAASRATGEGSGLQYTDEELAMKRAARVRVGLPVGLLLPAALTLIVHQRHRRGGDHARGIFVNVTSGGELRIWERDYGTRVAIRGAEVTERLVDVYAGRLGAWRQRRLKVRAGAPARGAVHEIEIAARAVAGDSDLGLKLEGGEGDCVELSREDFMRVRDAVLAAAEPAKG